MAIDFSYNFNTRQFSFSWTRSALSWLGFSFVAFGLAMLSAPWWQPVLISILGKANIVVNEEYSWQLPTFSIVFGLGCIAYKYFILDKNHARIMADKEIIRAANLNINLIRRFIKQLVDDHSYHSDTDREFCHLIEFFSVPENELHYSKNKKLYNEFVESALKLNHFVGAHFFVFPSTSDLEGNYKYCLYPNWNIDREMTIYDPEKSRMYTEKASELHELQKIVSTKFDVFIKHIKSLGYF